jgi:hypothetical protein
VVSLLLGSSLVFVPQAEAASASSARTVTQKVTRDYLDSGHHTTVDSRSVSLTVSQTTGLKSLQEIKVSWSGAHPTGGTLLGGANGDTNSDFAQGQEYPFALFECRGVDSASAPASQQITPETCWTNYARERYLPDSTTAWPAWRSDEYATAAERSAIVGAPANADSLGAVAKPCSPSTGALTRASYLSEHWVPFHAADGMTFAGGFDTCASQPPEASPVYSRQTLPSNETFAGTSVDGTGATNFLIFTNQDHPSLGCSQTVACALVAVPIEGISCDPAGQNAPAADRPTGSDLTQATANCETTGSFQPGQPLPTQATGAKAVSGYLWWSASNWRNRITVPLSFGPPDNACDLVNASQDELDMFGSGLMTQATTQWAPTFCLNKKYNFNFNHSASPEPLARNQLFSGAIEAALTSESGTYAKPTVNAPVGVTGFGIAFDIDDNNSQPVTNLKLDARLLAKLLTESYPAVSNVKLGYPKRKNPDGSQTATLSNNPYTLGTDPEFQALNPGIPARVLSPAATLLALNSSSDEIHALTDYINADPEARAWLNGTPDPWGMRVNPNYQNISLPVDTWPLLDTYDPSSFYTLQQCPDSGPLLPLVAAPTSRLALISQDMQYAISQSQTTCNATNLNSQNGDFTGNTMVAEGRQAVGHRFMLGLVSLGDAARYGLSLASLETQTASPWDPSWGQFTDGTGRTFVAPTNASLKTAADLLTQDSTTGIWPIPYSDLHTASDAAKAYPGTMVVYAAIPTKGLPKNDALHYSQVLTYAASAGQVPGPNQGQLPDGYLPMTAANGLGAMVDYTNKAATLVAAQQGGQVGGSNPPPSGGGSGPAPPAGGNIPPPQGLGPEPPGPVTIPGGNSGLSPSAGTGPGGTTPQSGSGNTPGGKLSKGRSGASGSTPSGATTVTPQATPAAHYTPRFGLGTVGLLLPIMLGVIVASGGTAAVIRLRRVRKAGS